MTGRLPQLFIVLCLAACQTRPAVVRTQTFDDQVSVPEGAEPEAEPEPEPEPLFFSKTFLIPEPEPEPEAEPKKAPDGFVPKPVLPKNMSFQETALARTVEQVAMGLVFAPILDGPCGIPTAIRATADSDGAGYTVDSCLRAVDAAHALTFERHTSKLGVIDVSSVAIRHDGEVLWSAMADCSELRQNDSACPSDFIWRVPKVRSMVGPLLSYELKTVQAMSGSSSRTTLQGLVVDVRKKRPAKFDALIDPNSILNALKRDSSMRRAVNPVELDAAKSLDAVWKLWRTQDFVEFGGYYFAEWDAERGQVAMHLWFLPSEDQSGDGLKELALWVTPKRQWLEAFEDAAGKSGFYGKQPTR